MPYGIAKGGVDFLMARAIWQSFANWHVKPYPSTVGQNQRKPNGDMAYMGIVWTRLYTQSSVFSRQSNQLLFELLHHYNLQYTQLFFHCLKF